MTRLSVSAIPNFPWKARSFILNLVFIDSQGDEEESKAVDLTQYEQTETYFIKIQGGKQYDMKIEHFDDLIQDNSLQSSWAGLDSFLIDEEFLYLEDAEADKIYAQLKQR